MANVELDYMEYATDAAAQAAYVRNTTNVVVPTAEYATGSNTLLCHFNGLDGAKPDADTGQTLTYAGGAAIDTAQKEFGTASLLLDGTGDYITVPHSADWAFGAGDFTIDFWMRINAFPTSPDTDGDMGIIAQATDGDNWWAFYNYNAGGYKGLEFVVKDGPATYPIDVYISNPGLVINTWYHVACVRSGTSIMMFLNGVKLNVTGGSVGTTALDDLTGTLDIGATTGPGENCFNGWIDELRIWKGTAVLNWIIQDYSEGTIKTQGSYSLKGVATITDSLNKTLTRTVT